MQLIFLYGQPASGKLTIARELAAMTGLPLFHNHLVVDAVHAVFSFGSAPFVQLREEFWLRTFEEAARNGISLIFTFAPEPTVAADFPSRVRQLVASAGGATRFVALEVSPQAQAQRLDAPDRSAFGKLRSLELLASLRPDLDRCFRDMPAPELVVDTTVVTPNEAAEQIRARVCA
jgi:chloramphenicol 3-O-phosphotransferase